jgi:predicted Zn-dependent protease
MPGTIGRERFVEVADAALSLEGVDGVEVLFTHDWGGLTRFANGQIHQSTASEDTSLRIRVVTGGRVGVASTNAFSAEGARAAARNAKEMAEVSAPDPLWPGFAPPEEVARVERFDEATAEATPEARADAIGALLGEVANGFRAAGAFETRAVEQGLANSLGQVCFDATTLANLSTVVTGGEGGSGFAEQVVSVAGAIDPSALGARANDKAVRSAGATPIEPGDYTVVLEPAATSTLVTFLGWLGFGGREHVERRSALAGKDGQQVASPAVTIFDDPADPRTTGWGFDFEGTPHRRVDLIRDGVFLDAVYDRRTALQAGRGADATTGHALPAPNPEGPFPLHLFMEEGDASLEEMIRDTDRGLLVTRFHYANVVNPMDASITAMTRDGTFLIEHGEITRPVVNLRCTQSILEALAATSMVGNRAELSSEFFFSAARVPAIRVDAFTFSGVSDH